MAFTRQQYMDHECTHRQYFAQFVTPEIKAAVRSYFGADRLCASTNPHFNDIPLSKWDMFTGYNQFRNQFRNKLYPNLVFRNTRRMLKEVGETGMAPSDLTCISKEAARQIVEEITDKQIELK